MAQFSGSTAIEGLRVMTPKTPACGKRLRPTVYFREPAAPSFEPGALTSGFPPDHCVSSLLEFGLCAPILILCGTSPVLPAYLLPVKSRDSVNTPRPAAASPPAPRFVLGREDFTTAGLLQGPNFIIERRGCENGQGKRQYKVTAKLQVTGP